MSWSIYDRLCETTTSTGTGDLVLGGAIAGYRTFSSQLADGDVFFGIVEAVDSNGVATGDWESCLFTYNSGANSVSRTIHTDGSNGGSATSFTAGTKRVHLAVTSYSLNKFYARAYLSATQTALNATAGFTSPTWSTATGFPLSAGVSSFWASGNPTRLTMPSWLDAKVRLRAQISLTNITSSDIVEAAFYINGFAALTGLSGPSGYHLQTDAATNTTIYIESMIYRMIPGDYAEARIKVGSDTSVDITTTTWFELEVLGPYSST